MKKHDTGSKYGNVIPLHETITLQKAENVNCLNLEHQFMIIKKEIGLLNCSHMSLLYSYCGVNIKIIYFRISKEMSSLIFGLDVFC